MKKLGLFLLFAVSVFGFSSSLVAAQSNLICIDGRPFIEKHYYVRGCNRQVEPYFTSLDLKAASIHGGSVNISVDWHIDPHCNDPRGGLSVHHLPLPIYAGIWDIFEDGETLGQVSFLTILPCRIKSNVGEQ